jgi:HSP20 family protein
MLFETSMTPVPVFGLRREMNRLFDDMMSRSMPATAWAPPVDVREDEHAIHISLEVPGVKPSDVEVTFDNGVLTIRGHKSQERKEGDENQYQLLERTYGSFSRSFRLPKGVDESKITAEFEHGVLDIQVPKAALPQPKRINVGVRGNGGSEQAQVQGQGSHGSQESQGAQSQQASSNTNR